jgi:hypothetical protein
MAGKGGAPLSGDALIDTLKKGCQGDDYLSCYLASLNLLGVKNDAVAAQETVRPCVERMRLTGTPAEVESSANCASLWLCLSGFEDSPPERAKKLSPAARQEQCLHAEQGSRNLTWGLGYQPEIGKLSGVSWTTHGGYGTANVAVLPSPEAWFCFGSDVNQEGVVRGFERVGDSTTLCSESLDRCKLDKENLKVSVKFSKSACYPGPATAYCITHDGPGRYLCSSSREGCAQLTKRFPDLRNPSGCVPAPRASRKRAN